MVSIKAYDFDDNVVNELEKTKYGKKWPIVYLINNDKELYVGETVNAYIRASQHLKNPERKNLKVISIIGDDTFNKSVILDLESYLIKYMSADGKYQLQNGNNGLVNHNYYQKQEYESHFKSIWNALKKKGYVIHDLLFIENTDIFKYSPYKSLTEDQYEIVTDIIKVLSDDVSKNKKSTFVVKGGAGTGKTIVGIYMIKLLSQIKDDKFVSFDEEDLDEEYNNIIQLNNVLKGLRIGLVIPMENLRKTLKKVFKNVKGLKPSMVLSPNDVAKSKEKYDLLIVDEAHRLRQRKNLTQYGTFDKNNRKFGLGKEGTELDWIIIQSKHRVLLYDEYQTIKPTDVDKEKIKSLKENVHEFELKTQMRCILGGEEYIKYIKKIFSNNPPFGKINFTKYDFKIFDDVDEMINTIKKKDKEYGLCRNIAGYGWKWNTKGKKLPMHITKNDVDKMIAKGIYDIEIDGHKYIWNTQAADWINSPNAINEIGCIHTIQGFDLNYTGLIIGNEIKYDKKTQKIIIDKTNYYDAKGKASASDDELLEYVLNIYSVMCTRGMRGTYLYVCDNDLKEYLNKYVDKYHASKNMYKEIEIASPKVADDGEEYKA